MSNWTAILSALAILQAGPATTPPPPAGNTVESLVVTAPGKTDQEQIAGFVSDITARGADKRVARWDRKVCPGVIGMKPQYAQVMIDRIAAVAQAVGLEVGAPGCKANILIIATDSSDAMVRQAVKDHPGAFGKYDFGVSRGQKALKAFVESEAPVRWWHVTSTKTADGERYRVGESVLVRSASRLKQNTRVDFDHVIIVLDTKRAGVVRFPALADYVAMVSLAQINPDADTGGVPTILNLFSDRAAGITPKDGLTDWDMAYLRGLYTIRRDSDRGERQEADVARTMTKTLAPPPAAKPQPGAKPAPQPQAAPKPAEDAEPKPELDREKPDRSGR